MTSVSTRRRALAVGTAALVLEAAVVAKRRGHLFDPNTVVRCRRGHLFTTLWVPGVSLKSVRLGLWRFQRCPAAGGHWSIVTPVRMSTLSEADREEAVEHRDIRIP
ncbi:MAG: hypothetical protein HKL82_05400 [Acidimicrobiaceae bacterium]|nr:hypothetical protein [Acidimicrobiaceae bacterium]